MSYPACPDCQSANVSSLSRDDDKMLVCNACGFGARGEWPNPRPGGQDPNAIDGYGGASAGQLQAHQQNQTPPDSASEGTDANNQMMQLIGALGVAGGGSTMLNAANEEANDNPEDPGSAENQSTDRNETTPNGSARAKGYLKTGAKVTAGLTGAWLVTMMLMFGTLGFFSVKIVDVPILKPAMEAVAKISCLGGSGSDEGCKMEDILGAMGESGAADALRVVWDCSNIGPNESRDTCDPNAIAQMEGIEAIPEAERWRVPVYVRAGVHYDVQWEVIAALHGANTNLGADDNCLSDAGKGGGQYDIDDATWEEWKVDAGEEKHSEAEKCWTHEPEDKKIKGEDGEEDTTVTTHVEYRQDVDTDPGIVADEDPRDMVDATYTVARILAAKGARDREPWEYNGSEPGDCMTDPENDGEIYGPPSMGGGGSGGGSLTGAGNSTYDDLITTAADKYGVPAAVIKGIIEQESGFKPDAGSPAGAQGLMQFMPATWAGQIKGTSFSQSDVTDPAANIDRGTHYIAQKLNDYEGNLTLALAGYNAGNGNVAKYGGVPPFEETQAYVRKIPARILKYSPEGWGDRIHLEPKFVDKQFEGYQKDGTVGPGEIKVPAGSLTDDNQAKPQKGFGEGKGGGTGSSTPTTTTASATSSDSGSLAGTPSTSKALDPDVAQWVQGDDNANTKDLNPVLMNALASVAKAKNSKIIISSGFRTFDEQVKLYALFMSGGGPVAAVPGTSRHESGNAADAFIGGVGLRDSAPNEAAAAGLHFPVASENWHTELIDAGSFTPVDPGVGIGGGTSFGPPTIWKGTQEYSGAEPSDRVSNAVMYKQGKDHSFCYTAVVHEWYRALTGEMDGSGEDTGGDYAGIIQAADLQMGWTEGQETDYTDHGGDNDMHYCGPRCDFGGVSPRSIEEYNKLGMKRNTEENGTGRWDCSSFVGYVLWIGGGVNVIEHGGNTFGIWDSHTNTAEFDSGVNSVPPGGWKTGDMIWIGDGHIEVIKSPTESYGWGSEPGKIHKVKGQTVYGSTITKWMRAKNLKVSSGDSILGPSADASFDELSKRLGGTQGVAVQEVGSTKAQAVGSLQSGVAWSTMKVPLAMAYIDGAEDIEVGNVTKALTESDNTAAEKMFAALGAPKLAGQQVNEQLKTFGDPVTKTQTKKLRPGYTAFGQTEWSLANQAKFASNLEGKALGTNVLAYMQDVTGSQRWGLFKVDKNAAAKGGWGPGSKPGAGGGAFVRQFGIITVADKHYAVAMASLPNEKSNNAGFDDMTEIAKWVKTAIETAPAGSEATPEAIDAYLEGKKSPMAGSGAAFIAAGEKYGIDPRFVVAIACSESACGKVTCGGAGSHNAWGWGCPNSPKRFDSWADGFETVSKGLKEGYIDEGRTSVKKIQEKYAPSNAANDPTGLNNHWVKNVTKFLTEMGGDPDNVAL